MSNYKQGTSLDQQATEAPLEASPEATGIQGNERRKLIIDLIIEHYISGTSKKLKLKDLSKRAGISRQALDRYYDDLKPFINGSRSISELTDSHDKKVEIQTQSAINKTESHYKDLIARNQARHEAELKEGINRHVTTLMNNDLSLLYSHTISNSLERQTLLNNEYRNTISELELKLALAIDQQPTRANVAPPKNNLTFNVGIEEICAKLGKTPDIDVFEDAKDEQILKTRKKLTTFANVPNVRAVIFAERYISRFNKFAEEYITRPNETALIVRLPLFTRTEFLNFTKHLPRTFKITVCVPHCISDIEKKAQREFMIRNIPGDELKAADKADAPNISWGFDEVINFKISQGD
ncbi:hypothetical protein I4N56_014915 [Pseudomonas mohnii]|uniref:hypothetical protein n=1 Tax=Pseudomonas mohnii TaxID=395600 RepID=UPI0018DD79FA|nr:hypothetical protein [Pseudomonas mohnii]MBH8612072.1 hypothetical protein [Pseudomonas mohnii]